MVRGDLDEFRYFKSLIQDRVVVAWVILLGLDGQGGCWAQLHESFLACVVEFDRRQLLLLTLALTLVHLVLHEGSVVQVVT